VLFCVKTYDTNTAVGLMRPLIGQGTVIWPLQNGVESPERMGRVVGEEHVIGGTTYVSSTIESPGIIKEIWDHKAYLGELDGERRPRIEQLRQTFARGEVAVEIPQDIHVAMWSKLLGVSAFTAVCCVTRLPLQPSSPFRKLLPYSVAPWRKDWPSRGQVGSPCLTIFWIRAEALWPVSIHCCDRPCTMICKRVNHWNWKT
jgi:hypothetical protein